MDYKVTFAAQADRDLFAIVCFLAERSSASAEKLGQALLDAALSLDKLPRRGTAVPGRPGVRKLIHMPHHLIFTDSMKPSSWLKSYVSGTAGRIQPPYRCPE